MVRGPITVDELLALPSLLTTPDVSWLPLPNKVDVVPCTDEPPPGLSRTAFAVLLTPDGSVLMARNRRRGIEYPGGHVEDGETMEGGLLRECREEAGVEPGMLRPLLVQRMDSEGTVPEGWKYPHPVGFQRFYVGMVEGPPAAYEENDECLTPVLVPQAEALSHEGPLSLSQRVILRAALAAAGREAA